jgi:hypothetical protein
MATKQLRENRCSWIKRGAANPEGAMALAGSCASVPRQKNQFRLCIGGVAGEDQPMPFGKMKQELVRLQHQLSPTKSCPDDGTEPAVIAATGGGHREARASRVVYWIRCAQTPESESASSCRRPSGRCCGPRATGGQWKCFRPGVELRERHGPRC